MSSSAVALPWIDLLKASEESPVGPPISPERGSPSQRTTKSPMTESIKRITMTSHPSLNSPEDTTATPKLPPRPVTVEPDTPDLRGEERTPATVKDLLDPGYKEDKKQSQIPSRSRIATPKLTPFRVTTESSGKISGNIVNPVVKGFDDREPLFTSCSDCIK